MVLARPITIWSLTTIWLLSIWIISWSFCDQKIAGLNIYRYKTPALFNIMISFYVIIMISVLVIYLIGIGIFS